MIGSGRRSIRMDCDRQGWSDAYAKPRACDCATLLRGKRRTTLNETHYRRPDRTSLAHAVDAQL